MTRHIAYNLLRRCFRGSVLFPPDDGNGADHLSKYGCMEPEPGWPHWNETTPQFSAMAMNLTSKQTSLNVMTRSSKRMMDQLVEAHRAGRHAYLEQEVCAVASAAGLVTGALDGHHIGFMEWSQLPEHMATIEEFRRVCDATQRASTRIDLLHLAKHHLANCTLLNYYMTNCTLANHRLPRCMGSACWVTCTGFYRLQFAKVKFAKLLCDKLHTGKVP